MSPEIKKITILLYMPVHKTVYNALSIVFFLKILNSNLKHIWAYATWNDQGSTSL